MGKIILIFLVIAVFLPMCESLQVEEENKSYSREWSAYQGQMKWYEAKAICASKGMRLPTLEEMEEAFEAHIMRTWIKEGKNYWTSQGHSYNRIYFSKPSHNRNWIYESGDRGGSGASTDNAYYHVRCIQF